MKVTVLDKFGEVRSVVDVPDSEHALKNFITDPDADATVVGEPPSTTARRINGQWVERPAPPSAAHSWNAVVAAWVDAREVESVRAAKLAEISEARLAAEYGGFEWDGSRFDSDPASQQRLLGALALAQFANSVGEPFYIDWTLADNSSRSLTAEEMIAVGRALVAHTSAVHARSRTFKAAVAEAKTLSELDAVKWST
jgi:hypothetical protein